MNSHWKEMRIARSKSITIQYEKQFFINRENIP